jgi:segregation and condensation protein B
MNEVSKLIAILFYSSEAVKIKSLSKNLNLEKGQILDIVDKARPKLSELGMTIIHDESEMQLVVKPEYASLIEEFYDSTPQALSQPALETLSVIAYKQPISKDEIDEIRGISSDQSIKNLLNKQLILRTTNDGITKYKTTAEFLKLMGIESLNELDNYENQNK